MITVVEHTDVPAGAHVLKELHQRTRPLGKLEAVNQLVECARRFRGVTTDHMAHVEFGHFIIGQIQRGIAFGLELIDQGSKLGAVSDLDPHKHMGSSRIIKAVVKFGNAAVTQQGQELAVATGLFRQGNGKNGFALFAEFGSFGHKAEAIKVHVRARGHGHQGFTLRVVLSSPGLHAGNGQRTGRLQH